MKTFRCTCGQRLFFENTQCLRCQLPLAYAPDRGIMIPVEEHTEQVTGPALSGATYRHCKNRIQHSACNWLVPEADQEHLCRSCRLNLVIPNLLQEGNLALWKTFEQGKRHLIFSLDQLGLPVHPQQQHTSPVPFGLGFKLLESQQQRVTTGHADGAITLNLDEVDPVKRERARKRLGEPYRTVLGHLRHEVGHYYWSVLIEPTAQLPRYRELFGDERRDYGSALAEHYDKPQADEWQSQYISNYASSHPWEDWAETWAHYLHILDTLETAKDFGVAAEQFKSVRETAPPHGDKFDALVDEWSEVSLALNALNRSMGQPDAYPFAVPPAVREKLRFVAATVARGDLNQSL